MGRSREELIDRTANDYRSLRESREGRGSNELATLTEARANGFASEHIGPEPAAGETRAASLRRLAAGGPIKVIDWTPFFRAWELAGNYPAILDDAVVGESARGLFADAQEMLEQIIAEKWLTAKGSVGLWPVRREGDDICRHQRLAPRDSRCFASR